MSTAAACSKLYRTSRSRLSPPHTPSAHHGHRVHRHPLSLRRGLCGGGGGWGGVALFLHGVWLGPPAALDRLAEKATPALDAMAGHADQWGAMQDEWVENARTTVREHPLAAIGAAVLFGMVIARLAR